MQAAKVSGILVENTTVYSNLLDREVKVDFYMPTGVSDLENMSLLLINDGQDLEKFHFSSILEKLYSQNAIDPLFCVAIHCGIDRRIEYGVAGHPDFKKRGARASLYTSFIFEELFSFINAKYPLSNFKEKAFAGFSLGGLTALDIVWHHPEIFKKVGVFSGSLWWRNIDQTDKAYDDNKHRIMHQLIRRGKNYPGLKFFLQCGNMDETKDRNHNGIIDSIDDTLDLIKELENKGYVSGKDIEYLEMPDGRHDVFTWGRAMPEFLKWGWGKS